MKSSSRRTRRVDRLRNSPVSQNDHLVSTLAKRLCWFRLETTAVIILVCFLVLSYSALALVVHSFFGAGLVDIGICGVSAYRSKRTGRLRISGPYDNLALIPPCDCSVDIVNDACVVVETISEYLFRTFRADSPNCSVGVVYRFASIRIVFNGEVLEVLLAVERLRLSLITEEDTIVVSGNCSIKEESYHSSIREFVKIEERTGNFSL